MGVSAAPVWKNPHMLSLDEPAYYSDHDAEHVYGKQLAL